MRIENVMEAVTKTRSEPNENRTGVRANITFMLHKECTPDTSHFVGVLASMQLGSQQPMCPCKLLQLHNKAWFLLRSGKHASFLI